MLPCNHQTVILQSDHNRRSVELIHQKVCRDMMNEAPLAESIRNGCLEHFAGNSHLHRHSASLISALDRQICGIAQSLFEHRKLRALRAYHDARDIFGSVDFPIQDSYLLLNKITGSRNPLEVISEMTIGR